MKKILFISICLISFLSCKEENDIIDFLISSESVSFEIMGGVKQVNVTSGIQTWSFIVSEEWLLVRRSQNELSFIADENIGDERNAQVDILYRGKVVESIPVVQEGIQLTLEKDEINFTSVGESKTVNIFTNTSWEIVSFPEWSTPFFVTNGLQIKVDRNYLMRQRVGDIEIASGNYLHKIKLIQEGCNWFESFEMVLVEGGAFMMGAQMTDSSGENYDYQAYQIESPVHRVNVSDYLICKYEVTQTQWQAVMGSNPSDVQGEDLPVTNVSWEEVQFYISKLNEATGKEYCLPTEAEWEFAAKGGNQSLNYKYSGSSVLGACGWFYSNSNSSINNIGTKEPNELNIYDMSGNVREWCEDWFDFYSFPAEDNPTGPSFGNMKINRGGSWSTPDVNCRNSYRHTDYQEERSNDLGFRIAMKVTK